MPPSVRELTQRAVTGGHGSLMDGRPLVMDNPRALEIRLLGPLEISIDGRQLDLGGGRHRAVLAVLALHAGEVVSSDRLIEALWGDSPPPSAAKSLQNHISRLRAEIGATALVTRAPGYVLEVDDDAIDTRRFEQLVHAARGVLETDPQLAEARLGEALALWRGEALAEFGYDAFAQTEIARLEELRTSAIEDRADARLAQGRASALVPELQALVAEHPARERLLGQLMLALYRSGRQADALEAYRAGRLALDRDLGLEPGPSLRALEQAILEHDPALGAPARLVARPLARPRRRAVVATTVFATLATAVIAGWALMSGGRSAPVVVPDSLVKIDPRTNEVVDVIRVGREPGQVEVVGQYVFVTSEEDGTLHRLDVGSGEVVTSGALAATGPLAVAGDFLWVTSDDRNEVVRIDPSSFLPIDRIPLDSNLVHAFVAVGGGSLWVSQYPSPAVSRWRLRTHELERRYALGLAEFPVEVTYAEGAAWIGIGGADELLRIDARTGATRRIAAGSGVSDPVYGFGSIWSGSIDDDAVWRTDAFTERTTATVPVGHVSFGLAVGAGSVWVSNHCDGTISRIDPDDDAVVASIDIGHYPRWLAFGHGFVWVGVSAAAAFEFPDCD